MAGKKTGQPVSFRMEPELAAEFDRFIETHRAWSKVEVAAVALHAFLQAGEEERLRLLIAYRTWIEDPTSAIAAPPAPVERTLRPMLEKNPPERLMRLEKDPPEPPKRKGRKPGARGDARS